MWKSGSSACSCCLARSRRNVEPTSVAIAGIGAVAESAEAMEPVARLKYCERFFCSALLCDSDALPACCCVDEGSLCSMPNAPKVLLVAQICCMRLMSSCRMCLIVASSISLGRNSLVHGMSWSVQSFRRFRWFWWSFLATAESHSPHAISHVATG